MPEQAGESVHVLVIDKAAFDRALRTAEAQASKSQKSIGSKMTKLGSQFSSVGGSLTRNLTLPLIGAGVGILIAAGNFEQGMNKIQALTQATEEDMAAMAKQAKDLGTTTKFSATQAAGGMEFLAKAGFEVLEITEAIGPSLTLAAAGGVDLARSADIASNVLQGFRLEAGEMARVGDVLTATFSNSNTNLNQLAEALKFAAPVAAGFGVSIEETSAAIGLLGNAGIQAGLAGTALRNSMAIAASATGQVKERMDELGLSLVNSQGNFVGIIEMLRQLEVSGATTAEIMQIFGRRAGPALVALLAEGSDSLADFTAELENSGGIAEQIASKQMEGFKGAMIELKSALEGLAIAIADSGLLEFAEGIARRLTKFVRGLRETNPKLLKMGTIIGGVAAAIGPMILVMGKMLSFFGPIISKIKLLGVVLKFAMANPIGAIIGILAILLLQNEKFRALLGKLIGTIGKLLSVALQPFVTILDILMSILTPLIDLIANVLVAILGPIVDLFAMWADGVENLQRLFKLLKQAIFDAIMNSGIGKVIKQFIRGFNRITGIVKGFFGAFGKKSQDEVKGTTDNLEVFNNAIKSQRERMRLLGKPFDEYATSLKVLAFQLDEASKGAITFADITAADLVASLESSGKSVQEFIDDLREMGASEEAVGFAIKLFAIKLDVAADSLDIIKLKTSEYANTDLVRLTTELTRQGVAWEIVDDVMNNARREMRLARRETRDMIDTLAGLSSETIAFEVLAGNLTLAEGQEIFAAGQKVGEGIDFITSAVEGISALGTDDFAVGVVDAAKEMAEEFGSNMPFAMGQALSALRIWNMEQENAIAKSELVIAALEGISSRQLALRVVQGEITIFEAGRLLRDSQELIATLDQIERTIEKLAGPEPIVSALMKPEDILKIEGDPIDFAEFVDLTNIPTFEEINAKFGSEEDLRILGIAEEVNEALTQTLPDNIQNRLLPTIEEMGDDFGHLTELLTIFKDEAEEVDAELVEDTLLDSLQIVGDEMGGHFTQKGEIARTMLQNLTMDAFVADQQLARLSGTLAGVSATANSNLTTRAGDFGTNEANRTFTGPVSITTSQSIEDAIDQLDRMTRGVF